MSDPKREIVPFTWFNMELPNWQTETIDGVEKTYIEHVSPEEIRRYDSSTGREIFTDDDDDDYD